MNQQGHNALACLLFVMTVKFIFMKYIVLIFPEEIEWWLNFFKRHFPF